MFNSKVTPGQVIGPIEDPMELLEADSYVPLLEGKVHVRSNMVLSINGSATVNGSSRELGDAVDSKLVALLRQWADVVLVGAATVRDENYFGVRMTEATAEERRARGQSDVPPIAVLTRYFSVDPESQFFTNVFCPPLILSPTKSLENPQLKKRRVQITEAGGIPVDVSSGAPADVINALAQLGFRKILLEGGPSMFGAFSAADLIDTHHFTISPLISIPMEKPAFSYFGMNVHRDLILESSRVSRSGTVLLRYGKKIA